MIAIHTHFFRDLYTELIFLVFYPWRRKTSVSDDVQKRRHHIKSTARSVAKRLLRIMFF